ncbi:DUF6264 family protein [Curtobacterium luteum]|uniref:DUF6264 family protein n=1 Tax=Curtobacterium luteum TaxID=33881 RepID=UPI003819EF27
MSGDWSSAPVHDPAPGRSDDDREARRGSVTSAAAPAAGRVHGTPAPQYGEYAPEGWVNPVLAEQERVEREAESRALREQAAREAAETPARRGPTGSRAARAGAVRATPSSRFGASPLDFGMTVGLLVLGLWSVLQSLSVGQVASAVRQTFEQRYTTFSDPSVLTGAAIVGAVASVVLFALTLWWSIRRLRARRWTFWVPLLGGVVSTAVSVTVFLVVVLQDPRLVDAVLRSSGGA